MAEMLDMPLDDIVTKDRSSRRGRGGARGGRVGGPVRRARGARSAPYTRGNSDGMWQHDLNQDAVPARGAGGAGVAIRGGGKIIVSNLNPNIVKDEDMRELFGRVGRLKSARCHYDARGRNLGTAEVEFHRAEDAMQAKREYDGVALDGRKMKIELVVDSVAPRVNVVNRLAPSGQRTRGTVNNAGGRGGRGGDRAPGGRGAGAGGRGRGRGRGNVRLSTEEQAKLATDLDADLDAYMEDAS